MIHIEINFKDCALQEDHLVTQMETEGGLLKLLTDGIWIWYPLCSIASIKEIEA